MSTKAVTTILEGAPVEHPHTLIAVDLETFLTTPFPARESILSPWLPKAGLCMIHAYRGIGKTHLSLGIACAVANAGKFLDWKAPEARNVVYIDGEMPASVLQERLTHIISMMKLDIENLPGKLEIITPDMQKCGMPDLATHEGQALLNQRISEETDLIIIDNLSCLAPSVKENDATDWAIIQTWVLGLRAKGKSVLLIHHSGKGGAQRGTSRKEDVLDTVITLKRPDDYEASQGARFIVNFEKARGFHGKDAESFEAQLRNNDDGILCWETRSVEGNTCQQVTKMLKDGMKQAEIASELSVNKSTVSRHAKTAREQGLINAADGKKVK